MNKQNKEAKLFKIGITQGDINGIGYEVIIKTLMNNKINELCTPIVYGSPKIAAYHRKAINIQNFSLNIIKSAENAHHKRSNVINCTGENARVELGKASEIGGAAAFESLQLAMDDLKNGRIDALVTAPINKKCIQSKDFNFPGHTEYINSFFPDESALMIMVSDLMKIGIVAGHIPVSDLPNYVTKERVLKNIRILNKSLIEDFGIRKPKIAVLGLNPHAGDNGVIGSEEKTEIEPALEVAQHEGIVALGPYPADGFFGSNAFRKFDGVLAMYHDQGLTPFKALSFEEGVNFTAGLPIVRTSPGHGTAFEIAGQGIADPGSFRNALFLAIDVCRNRIEYKKLTENALQPQEKHLESEKPSSELPKDFEEQQNEA